MVLGSMRYWDVNTMALTPPSTGTLSCSTEREQSRQAPRGRSVHQRLRQSRSHCLPTGDTQPWREDVGLGQRGCTKLSPNPKARGPGRPHRSTMQSLRGCGAMLSVT